MPKVTLASSQTVAGSTLKIDIPAGLRVIPANNLPESSPIKYWLDELTPEMEADAQIESHFRNYGIGLDESEVTEKEA